MSLPHPTPEARRAGIAPSLVVLALALVAGLVLLWLRPWDSAGGGEEGLGPATPEPTVGAEAEADLPAPPLEDGMRDDGGIQVTERRDPEVWERSYEGTGILSGSVSLPAHLPMPATWELVIEPSLFGVAREHAGTRRVTLSGDQVTFEEHDLPLGGYRVRARAAGFTCMAHEVELFRVIGQEHLPGRSHVHLMLALQPGSWVEAVVRDPGGGLVADVPVVLLRGEDGARFESRTNGNGVLRFEGLEDGRYGLVLGDTERPLLPRVEVAVTTPGVELEDLLLPPLGSLHLRVTDAQGRPLEEVPVRGFGPAPVDVRTGFDGQVRVPFLPPGEYDLRVEGLPSGHEGRLSVRVEVGEPPLATLVCQVP